MEQKLVVDEEKIKFNTKTRRRRKKVQWNKTREGKNMRFEIN